MNAVINQVRNYNFVPLGEFIRGFAITIVATLVQVAYHTDLSTITNWHAWLISLAIAGATAGIAYLQGHLPPVTPAQPNIFNDPYGDAYRAYLEHRNATAPSSPAPLPPGEGLSVTPTEHGDIIGPQ